MKAKRYLVFQGSYSGVDTGTYKDSCANLAVAVIVARSMCCTRGSLRPDAWWYVADTASGKTVASNETDAYFAEEVC